MKYNITQGAFSQIHFILNKGEYVDSEADAFIFSNKEVQIEGKNAKDKSLFQNFKKSLFTGESMFTSRISALEDETHVKFGAAILGQIQKIDINETNELYITDGAYLADVGDVDFTLTEQKLKTAMLGISGFRILKFHGLGVLFINGFGNIEEVEITNENVAIVDNQNVLAWTSGVNQEVHKASNNLWSSMTSGEGFVSKFSGNGKVYIQTHSLKRQTQAQQKYIVKQ